MVLLAAHSAMAQPNAAAYNAIDLVPDQTSLVPLNEWVPIFGFSMTFPIDAPAVRMLAEFQFRLTSDPNGGERTYNLQPIVPSDIYQFAIFEETGPNTGVLDIRDRVVKGRSIRGATPHFRCRRQSVAGRGLVRLGSKSAVLRV